MKRYTRYSTVGAIVLALGLVGCDAANVTGVPERVPGDLPETVNSAEDARMRTLAGAREAAEEAAVLEEERERHLGRSAKLLNLNWRTLPELQR